ncbi:hypothetical protein BACCAP_01148 [Pseudoflavonifractor capillosus ATCC 29799]|uniref:Uncharacterized protein n=1 Tax=Pseudoflavonifractor capillosus ATCC 29799 TaxID=411467 RepID=A6NSG9_9FIRM|nr:hypothetical protein BACCAP_01148 [Pseudoflavonifractor capillosus ATCC 29799]
MSEQRVPHEKRYLICTEAEDIFLLEKLSLRVWAYETDSFVGKETSAYSCVKK